MKKNEIKTVLDGSIAQEIGLEPGDVILKINNQDVRDILDYRFLMSDEEILLTVLTKQGEEVEVEIEKEVYEDLGVEFESGLIDGAKSCANRCVFCFIDQLPKGMRETLYFKDDDTRLSFFQGNYVTLTNISDKEIDRLISMRVSPINISVHTTNPTLRVEMLKNKNAGKIMEIMKKFSDNGILINAQIVLCPTLNDGKELEKTLSDLLTLGHIRSVSVVPIGKTKHREGLCEIPSVTKEKAQEVLSILEKWQKEALKKAGTRLFYASDEFYLKAEREIPSSEEYEGFPQIENGVGLIASMKEEFYNALEDDDYKLSGKRKVSIATGEAAYNFIKSIAKDAEKRYNGLMAEVYKVTNNFFGEEITVAGLLCGSDIIASLSGKDLGDELLISKAMLRDSTTVLLDDVTTEELENKLNVKIRAVENDGYEFLEALLGM